MAEAAAGMKDYLSRVAFQNAACPVAMNVDGECHQGAGAVQEALAQQLDHSVEWVKAVESPARSGLRYFIECGSGRGPFGTGPAHRQAGQLYSTETAAAIDGPKTRSPPHERGRNETQRSDRGHYGRRQGIGKAIATLLLPKAPNSFLSDIDDAMVQATAAQIGKEKERGDFGCERECRANRGHAKSSSMRRLTSLVELIYSSTTRELLAIICLMRMSDDEWDAVIAVNLKGSLTVPRRRSGR